MIGALGSKWFVYVPGAAQARPGVKGNASGPVWGVAVKDPAAFAQSLGQLMALVQALIPFERTQAGARAVAPAVVNQLERVGPSVLDNGRLAGSTTRAMLRMGD